MAETQTADLAEKQTAYKQGLEGYLKSQTQPQSFMEHPATAMIPIIGPILSVSGRLQVQKRLNRALVQASDFNTKVQSGLFPEGPEGITEGQKMGIPLPLIVAGQVESKKVRATPGFQGRQLFEAAMPTWNQKPMEGEDPQAVTERNAAAFQSFAQQNPEVFGSLGSQGTGELALKNIYTIPTLTAMQQQGLGGPSWFRGGQGGGGITQTSTTPQAPATQPPVWTPTPARPPAQTTATPTGEGEAGLAQRAQARGIDPRTVLALKGNEGSGPQAVSPKKAIGTFQLLKDTARRHLPPEFKNISDAELEEALKDPQINEELASKEIGRLEKLYPGRPDLVAAAYFSGEGNVKDGKIVNPNLSDGNMTVQKYVDAFLKRYEKATISTGGTQAQAPTKPETPNGPAYQPFNPQAQAPVPGKSSLTVSPQGPSITMEGVSLADRAAAHLTEAVMTNPRNYRQAYMDLAQKRALPPPERLKEIQLQAASMIYQDHENRLINQGYKPNTDGRLETEALKRTFEDMGAMSPEVAKALMDIPTRQAAIEFMKHEAAKRSALSPTADQLRSVEAAQAGTVAEQQEAGTTRAKLSPGGYNLREAEKLNRLDEKSQAQRQEGRIRGEMPLGEQGEEGMKIAQRYGVPPETTLKGLSKRVLLPDDLQKEGAAIDKLVEGLGMLKRYYVETDPRKKGTFLASIQGHLKSWGTGIGLNPNVKDYKDMVTAFARILGTITTETGGKYTKEDVEQYLMAIPNEKLTSERAFQRFDAFEDMVSAAYLSRLKTFFKGEPPLLEKFRQRYPEVQLPGEAPPGQGGSSTQSGTTRAPAAGGGGGEVEPTYEPNPRWKPDNGEPRIKLP